MNQRSPRRLAVPFVFTFVAACSGTQANVEPPSNPPPTGTEPVATNTNPPPPAPAIDDGREDMRPGDAGTRTPMTPKVTPPSAMPTRNPPAIQPPPSPHPQPPGNPPPPDSRPVPPPPNPPPPVRDAGSTAADAGAPVRDAGPRMIIHRNPPQPPPMHRNPPRPR